MFEMPIEFTYKIVILITILINDIQSVLDYSYYSIFLGNG